MKTAKKSPIPPAIQKARSAMNETNDCALIAVAIATGKPYEDVHRVFKLIGRKNRRGVWPSEIKKVVSILGYETKVVGFLGKTTKTLKLPRDKNYLAATRDHVVAVRYGLVKCWSHTKAFRIREVWEVTERGVK